MTFYNMKNLSNNEAEISIYGPVQGEGFFSEGAAKDFQESLKSLGDVQTIHLYINSPGGSVFEGQAIHSMIKRHQAKVIVHVDGIAASIASVIAMAGDEIHMPENAMMMIHNALTIAIGNASEFRKVANDLEKITDSIRTTYVSRSNGKISDEKAKELMDEETWLNAKECETYGFCDEVEDGMEAVATMDERFVFNTDKVPESLKQGKAFESKYAKQLADLDLLTL